MCHRQDARLESIVSHNPNVIPAHATASTVLTHPSAKAYIAPQYFASSDTVRASGDTTTGLQPSDDAADGSVGTTAINLSAAATVLPVPLATSDVLTVGSGEEYATLSAALAAAHDGDTIDVKAGTYVNDFATVDAKVTIQGVGGVASFVATEAPTNLKGILTVDDDVTIKNLSFSGAAIDDADGGNAAGIRYEGGVMVLDNDTFSHNQDGILANPVLSNLTTNTITITGSTFSDNGSGSGYTHNLYVNEVSNLTVTGSTFEGAVVGHEFKSRADVNVITDNTFRDGPTGTASYDIDLPNGGKDTLTGNVIEKGPESENDSMVHFGGEGIPYAGSSLTVSGNTFENDLGPQTVAVLNQTAISAAINNNTFDNIAASQLVQGPATGTGNVDGSGNPLPPITQSGVLPGNTVVYTDDLPHSITLDGSTIQAVEGGGGLLTAYASGGHVIAIGGSGGMVFSEGPTSGGNSITTAAGSTNSIAVVGQDLIDSEGHDAIRTGGGNITGVVNGSATISDGDADNQWTVNGTASIVGNGGNPQVSIGATGSASVTGALGNLIVSNDGGRASISVTQGGAAESLTLVGGAAVVSVYGGQAQVSTASGPVGTDLSLGLGTASVTSLGADTITAGSGSDTVIVSGKSVIHAGTGSLSVFGRGDTAGATVYAAAGDVTLNGDTGNITYVGGAQASTLELDLSSNTVLGGSGHLTVHDGSRESISGGSGGLTYLATDGGGANTIATVANSANLLQLAGADMVQSHGNDTITGGSGNQVITATGNARITDGTGASQVVLSGNDTLSNGGGEDFVTVTGGASATVAAGTGTVLNEAGATVRFSAGAASATVSGGAATLGDNGGTVVATTTAPSGSAVTVSGAASLSSVGADTVHAGSGTEAVTLHAAHAQVWGGAGTLSVSDQDGTTGDGETVHGGSGALSYDQGPGALTFIGGTGSASINAEYGSANVMAGSGNITLTGGSAGLSFTAGTGHADVTLTPGGGTITLGSGSTTVHEASYGAADTFNFQAGHGGGTDVVTGFRFGVDRVNFGGLSITSATQGTGGLNVTLNDGTHITMIGAVGTPSA